MAATRLAGHLFGARRCLALSPCTRSSIRAVSSVRGLLSSQLRAFSVASGVNPVRFQGQDLPPSPDVIVRPPPGYVELEKVKKDGSTIRFYVDVGVAPVDEAVHPAAKGQWAVKLGGKHVLTPKRNLFAVPSEALAYAIAQEWDAQIEKIKPTSMPLMKLATSSIDMTEEARPRMFEDLRKNANNDNICVRATAPHTLVKLQRKHHDPLLKWASEKHGINLELIETVFPKRQARATMQKVEEILNGMDKWTLSAFDFMAATTKSFIIPLAVLEHKIDIAEAVAASRTEENFQMQLCGEIRDVHGLDEAYVRLTIAAARVFVGMLRGVPNANGELPTAPQVKV